MHVLVISIILVCVSSLENIEYGIVPEGIIVANIKKRDIIPLQPGNRRLLDNKNLNYRRTKDIRETSVDRHFEITEALLREAQREGQLSSAQADDMREDEIKIAQRPVEEIRTETREGVKDEARDDVRDENIRDDVRDGVRDDSIKDDIKDNIRDDVRVEAKVETEAIINRESYPFENDDMVGSEFLRNDNKKTHRNDDDNENKDKVQRQFSWLTIENDDGGAIDI
ncbi:PREDICTED: uncharacterized protein LOC106114639 [Papilio xuthus]|uniref:Uncharacterized protein LOC106114639 n=1 Tax=Papilio xuthus TaxID=66420 RepID=A0AAJ6Z1S2_PAPXU|nr:PREDICTED: uncharacterized protein LOC106114639 [Papilio xuthus]